MGEIREEVQSFYMRDYVEEKVVVIEHFYHFYFSTTSSLSLNGVLQVETRLIEQLSLSDLV